MISEPTTMLHSRFTFRPYGRLNHLVVEPRVFPLHSVEVKWMPRNRRYNVSVRTPYMGYVTAEYLSSPRYEFRAETLEEIGVFLEDLHYKLYKVLK